MATFWEIAVPRLTICSLLYFDFFNISMSRFGFEGWIFVLIASVPDLCILFTIQIYEKYCKIHSLKKNTFSQITLREIIRLNSTDFLYKLRDYFLYFTIKASLYKNHHNMMIASTSRFYENQRHMCYM